MVKSVVYLEVPKGHKKPPREVGFCDGRRRKRANRQFAVVVADWGSVGGAWEP